ncbi:hypothetical protein [Mycobacteroides abscessus]|uniref:hypothetical protein n=1 Tax=Mycobacteroides abscessus TaxID=36809 RepID=UPI0009278085|nr:hypothetical protein [Mycobacteroides abscessus]MDM2083386.1 hypothetical protein [Mycobacteroides abscessus]MDM2088229.1 hypothetical protein [Mycobacteroides abscessus]MDO3096250.1 hypothetical protein [Mycobacteroides abscessus subsp. abscessus]SHQ07256.1 Uncharacterised protein [Mycobacteroides abscessus subsp. abscessus]SHQ54514.1 Uncharacterised protein [Mycobacteroides abscessus subsp. abscessus]
MTNINDITKLIEASSLGTRSARAARRSVTAAQGEAIARRAARSGKAKEKFRGTDDEGTYSSVSGSTTGRIEGKENTMAKGHNRSAITGRYVTAASAKRNPKTTVTERGANHSNGTHHRSAITGKFVKGSTAARHPDTTVTERG